MLRSGQIDALYTLKQTVAEKGGSLRIAHKPKGDEIRFVVSHPKAGAPNSVVSFLQNHARVALESQFRAWALGDATHEFTTKPRGRVLVKGVLKLRPEDAKQIMADLRNYAKGALFK